MNNNYYRHILGTKLIKHEVPSKPSNCFIKNKQNNHVYQTEDHIAALMTVMIILKGHCPALLSQILYFSVKQFEN